MRYWTIFILIFLCKFGNNIQVEGQSPLYVYGIVEWEILCAKVDRQIKTSHASTPKLSFIVNKVIKHVEKLEIIGSDTTNTYFLTYNRQGWLSTMRTQYLDTRYCIETRFSYTDQGYLSDEESTFCGFVDPGNMNVTILPTKEVLVWSDRNRLQVRKLYYSATKRQKPHLKEIYNYNERGLIEQIKIYKGKKLLKQQLFRYKYY